MNKLKDFKDHFSTRVKDLRKNQRKMTQIELAEKLKVKQSKISNWENNDTNFRYPSIEEIYKIAEEFRVSLSSLFPEEIIEPTRLQPSNNVDMLHFIADIMNRSDIAWEATSDIFAERVLYLEEPCFEYNYLAGFCTNDYRFRDFIHEYKIAIMVGKQTIQTYGISPEIAESMKNKVLEKYQNIFEETSCAIKDEKEILETGDYKFNLRGERIDVRNLSLSTDAQNMNGNDDDTHNENNDLCH